MKEITLRSIIPPTEDDLNNDIEWFCESMGLLGERDKNKTGLKIFKTITMSKDKGVGIDDISEDINLSRTTVIHHIKSMMESGLVIKENGLYILRMKSLQKIVDEIEIDIGRMLKSVRDIAKDIDEEIKMPVRGEKKDYN